MSSLRKVTKLDESPIDFMRGAAREAGRKIAQSGAVRTVKDLAAAGTREVAKSDIRAKHANVIGHVQRIAKLVAQLDALRGVVPEERPQGRDLPPNARPADAGQRPAQQQTDNVSMAGDAVPDAFRTTGKPRAVMGKHGPELKFEEFLRAKATGDLQTLEEWSAMPFLKGVGKQLIKKALDMPNNGILGSIGDIYRAGNEENAYAKKQKTKVSLSNELKQLERELQSLGASKTAALKKAVGQLDGPELQRRVMHVIARRMPDLVGRPQP